MLGSVITESLNAKVNIDIYDDLQVITNTKADIGGVYTKVEADARENNANSETADKLDAKAVVINNSVELKADRTELDNYMTTTDINATLSNKADKTDLDNYTTTTDINATLSNKAD